jgi:hypothetical protein
MYQKDATCENTERAQGTEKLTANANDGKHIRKSRKSQKGGNEHKKSKSIECNAESKATEQPKSTTETTDQEQRRVKERRPKPAESKKQFPETRPCPPEENRSENGKSSGARGGEATSTEFINFAGSVRKAFTFLCFHPFGFHRSALFRSVFLVFCSWLFRFVSHFPRRFFFS